jgi:hypothetical protein
MTTAGTTPHENDRDMTDRLFAFMAAQHASRKPFFGFAFMNLFSLFGKTRPDVFKVFLDVMVHANQGFLKFNRRHRYRGLLFRLLGRRLCRRLFLLYMDGASVGQFFNFGAAAGGAGDKFFLRLFLKVFETRKPAFETMIFLAAQIVDNHMIPL